MKICYLLAYPGLGGSEEYVINLATEAVKSGDEVICVLGGEGPLSDRLRKNGIVTHYVPMKSSFNPIAVIRSVMGLKKIFKAVETDIVHTQMLREQSLAILAKIFRSKIKIIRTYHRLDNFNWKMRPLLPLYNKYTDSLIAVSEHMSQNMVAFGLTKPIVILNGVKKLEGTGHDLAVGYLGRVVREKGIYEIAKRWEASLPNLVIGGAGPDLGKIRSLSRDNIKLLGLITSKAEFFKKINVLIIASDTESTLPLVALEAYSVGVPVISFDLPALSDLILRKEDLVKSGDYDALIEKAVSLSKSGLTEKKQQVYQDYYSERFSVGRMWSDTRRLYQSLVG